MGFIGFKLPCPELIESAARAPSVLNILWNLISTSCQVRGIGRPGNERAPGYSPDHASVSNLLMVKQLASSPRPSPPLREERETSRARWDDSTIGAWLAPNKPSRRGCLRSGGDGGNPSIRPTGANKICREPYQTLACLAKIRARSATTKRHAGRKLSRPFGHDFKLGLTSG